MAKKILIAEKPSVAMEFAKVLKINANKINLNQTEPTQIIALVLNTFMPKTFK